MKYCPQCKVKIINFTEVNNQIFCFSCACLLGIRIDNNLYLIDIINMPKFNPTVTNGLDSVSRYIIYWDKNNYVSCAKHGACNSVSKDGRIWRCTVCHEGGYIDKFI